MSRFWSRSRSHGTHQIIPEPETKRISTPAGQRLSVILENGNAAPKKNLRDSHRASVRKSGLSAALADAPRDSMDEKSGNSGYTFSVWSDGEKKLGALRNHKQIAKRGGWRKLALILAIILILIIALAVGLALGLKKPNKSSNADANTNTNTNNLSQSSNPSSSSPSSPSSASSSLPPNFPLGSYSLVTFLDTVQTNCTASAATWSCYPYTTYYTNVAKSAATFNWIISGSPNAYKISSTQNPFGISFKNADLALLDAGKDTERYRFQISQTKVVAPRSNITEDNAATSCDFDNTNLQAYLYTKMAKSWPDTDKGDPSGEPSFTTWPFAVRVEQAVGGGENVPSCHKQKDGQSQGDKIPLKAQDAGALCSCLYKNWHTPKPGQ
ncbi:hypothetical protein DM02DRAFT_612450 [Periconia macrospinosa]|uniref:Tat pathway signal sequence n=1 Tax=Periconia macrospinosa TaxID=97972 RepID=A0A2V1DXZ7_9PLEO|nr:hypothetical protein DM02DRAFT_612450 [Periconia macrospinosa]